LIKPRSLADRSEQRELWILEGEEHVEISATEDSFNKFMEVQTRLTGSTGDQV